MRNEIATKREGRAEALVEKIPLGLRDI